MCPWHIKSWLHFMLATVGKSQPEKQAPAIIRPLAQLTWYYFLWLVVAYKVCVREGTLLALLWWAFWTEMSRESFCMKDACSESCSASEMELDLFSSLQLFSFPTSLLDHNLGCPANTFQSANTDCRLNHLSFSPHFWNSHLSNTGTLGLHNTQYLLCRLSPSNPAYSW